MARAGQTAPTSSPSLATLSARYKYLNLLTGRPQKGASCALRGPHRAPSAISATSSAHVATLMHQAAGRNRRVKPGSPAQSPTYIIPPSTNPRPSTAKTRELVPKPTFFSLCIKLLPTPHIKPIFTQLRFFAVWAPNHTTLFTCIYVAFRANGATYA